MIDYTFEKLKNLPLSNRGKWRTKLKQDNPMTITIIRNPGGDSQL